MMFFPSISPCFAFGLHFFIFHRYERNCNLVLEQLLFLSARHLKYADLILRSHTKWFFFHTYKMIKFSYNIGIKFILGSFEFYSYPENICHSHIIMGIRLHGLWLSTSYASWLGLFFSSHFSELICSSKNEMYSLDKAWFVLLPKIRKH